MLKKIRMCMQRNFTRILVVKGVFTILLCAGVVLCQWPVYLLSIALLLEMATVAFYQFMIHRPTIRLMHVEQSQNDNIRQKRTVEIDDITAALLEDNQRAEMNENNKELQLITNMQFLLSQIDPHFLYNALETIRGKALVDGNEDISEMTRTVADYFRYNISNRSNVVTIRDELCNIRDYFDIIEFRFGNRFLLEIDEKLYTSLFHYCIPKLTLQPILENAIMHGLDQTEKNGVIQIRIDQTERELCIYISDNGVGIPAERLHPLNMMLGGYKEASAKQIKTSGNGIALMNINSRLKLHFGGSAGLRIYSTPGIGTKVEIVLPKICKEDLLKNTADQTL